MFSPEELQLIVSDEFFHHKKKITEKIYTEFYSISTKIQTNLENLAPRVPLELLQNIKINRGENLEGLPWINMDCPGWFKKGDVFAIRYLFWWAKHFSITLHLAGEFLPLFNSERLFQIKNSEIAYWNIHSSPWKYHYGDDNYVPVKSVSTDLMHQCLSRGFVKISFRYALPELLTLQEVALAGTTNLLQLLK